MKKVIAALATAAALAASVGTAAPASAAPTVAPTGSSTTTGIPGSDFYVYGHPTVRIGQPCPYTYAASYFDPVRWYRTGDTRTRCYYYGHDGYSKRTTSWAKR